MRGIAEQTGVVPLCLQNKPELHGDLPRLWDAFCLLSAQRPSGVGISPIPLRDMREWMDEYGCHDRDEFIKVMRAVDDEWLRIQPKKQVSDVEGAG